MYFQAKQNCIPSQVYLLVLFVYVVSGFCRVVGIYKSMQTLLLDFSAEIHVLLIKFPDLKVTESSENHTPACALYGCFGPKNVGTKYFCVFVSSYGSTSLTK